MTTNHIDKVRKSCGKLIDLLIESSTPISIPVAELIKPVEPKKPTIRVTHTPIYFMSTHSKDSPIITKSVEPYVIKIPQETVTLSNLTDNLINNQTNPLLLIYKDLHSTLQKYKSMNDYLRNNRRVKLILDDMVKLITSDQKYRDNCLANKTSILGKLIVAYDIVENHIAYQLPTYSKISSDLTEWLTLNRHLDTEKDKYVIQAGFIARFYI
jgi:hypothetical protein